MPQPNLRTSGSPGMNRGFSCASLLIGCAERWEDATTQEQRGERKHYLQALWAPGADSLDFAAQVLLENFFVQ